jgi:hypothetical protein
MKGINFDIKSEEDKSWRDKLPLLKSKEKIAENAREYTKEVAEKAVDDAIEEITATYEDIIGDLQANYDKDNKYHDRFYESLRLSNTKIENREQMDTIMKESSTITSGDFAVYSDIDADLEQTYGERAEAQRVAYVRGMKDPIIGAIADTYTRWVVGRGVKFSFQDHKVQKVVDKFWEENDMDSKLKERYWRYVLESEMFSVLHKDPERGECYIRDVNPREITKVETHPEDKQNRFAYKREFRDTDGKRHVMYYPDIDYYDDYRDGKLSVQKSVYEDKEEWTGRNTVMHYLKWMNNREVRSRVFLQRVMKWVEWFKDWIIDRAIINHEKGRVVWILTVTSEKMRKKLGNVVSAPAGGKIKVETPNRKWQPVSADIRADNVKEDGMFLMYQICTGVSIPLHVLTQRVSEQVYSSIRKSETPFSMAILDKQHTLAENYIKPILREVIRTAAKSDGNKSLNRKIRIDDYVRESVRREFKGILKDYRNDNIDADGLLESIKELSDRSLQDIRSSKRAARAKIRLSRNLESLRKSCNKSYVRLIESGFNEEAIQEDVNEILAEAYDLFESGVTVQINAEECPVKITFPDLVKEDYLEMAKVLKIYDEIGLYSKETLREKSGCDDPAREKHLIKQEMKEWRQRRQKTQQRQQDNAEEDGSSEEETSEGESSEENNES